MSRLLPPIISVDDHVVEPPDIFSQRAPRAIRDAMPRFLSLSDGSEVWEFEGERFAEVGLAATAGWPLDERSAEPRRLADIRSGCYKASDRVTDMDTDGIQASVNFPSMISGFCGRRFFGASRPEVGGAAVRAWNDWYFDEWFSPYPDRFIPLGIAYLPNPKEAANEIHRNAARGFRSVSLPERPHLIGLPSLWDTDFWMPIMSAIVDTETVISLHVGSCGLFEPPPGPGNDALDEASARAVSNTLFPALSMVACVEWLWSGWTLRFPELKIAMSEGGIGWVPMLIDRLNNMVDHSGFALDMKWPIRPSEVLRKNFYFCTISDPSVAKIAHLIGLTQIMVETDYPHADGTWPHSRESLREIWAHLRPEDLERVLFANAAELFRYESPVS